MPGSSRALSKALDTLFSEWTSDEEDSNSQHILELYSIISQYLTNHNTSTSIQQQPINVNDELFRVYDKYIMPVKNLSRECMFLDILTKLSSVLTNSEIRLWVKSYLKPAVDSAGYDSIFVEKSREFIKKVSSQDITEDPNLQVVRDDIGRLVIEQILAINLSQDTLEETLDLKVSEIEKDSQTYQERLRFIKSNCNKLLLEYGINKTKQYCELLNHHMLIPSQRLQTLTLLLSVVSSMTPGISQIINCTIFPNILKCAMFDFSKTIIHTSITILTMLIPQVTDSISSYLPDLLMIYIRITTWPEFNQISNRFQLLSEYLNESDISWNITVEELDEEEADELFTFNYPNFYVLLYGLFPMNFCKFSQGPYPYLKLNQPKFINLKYLQRLESELSISLDSHIIKTTKSIIQGFLVHPKFLTIDNTITQELENPTAWIEHQDVLTHEEIALACFSLNPDVVVNFNDESSIYDRMLTRSLTSQTDIESMKNNNNTRGSSFDESRYLHLKSFQNLRRKLSIIPTNLVVVNKESESPQAGVHFNEVKYEGEMEDSIDSLDAGGSRSPGDPLHDLFQTHEKLYGPITKGLRRKSSSFLINEKLKHELRLSRPTSSPTTTLETSSVFKESPVASSSGSSYNETLTTGGGGSTSGAPIPTIRSDGNMVDFYQRELLLFKNELEFSSYMKHLNKYNYIKLRSKLNNHNDNKTLEDNNIKKLDSLKLEYDELNEILTMTKDQLSQAILDHEKEREVLVSRLDKLQIDKEELVQKFESMNLEYKIESKKLKELVDVVIPEKDFEIVNLQMKLNNIQDQLQQLETKLESVTVEDNRELEKNIQTQEDLINKLKSELNLITEKHNQVVLELSKSQESLDSMNKKYEHKLTNSKLNLNENLNSFTSQYERKIQELTTTILKYEHLLEEKNGKIIQLSSSKPISIPSYRRSNSYNFEQHTERSHSSSESSSPPSQHHQHHHPHPPAPIVNYSHYQPQPLQAPPPPHAVRTNSMATVASSSTQQVPIMRGRGGYQKRSKKLM
ncbi:Tuberous sclerosis 1 protein [Spathaspora sp. JA1]|nr:Tuberous sclerosis 1 protein [Spathaspora sp. JA1]